MNTEQLVLKFHTKLINYLGTEAQKAKHPLGYWNLKV